MGGLVIRSLIALVKLPRNSASRATRCRPPRRRRGIAPAASAPLGCRGFSLVELTITLVMLGLVLAASLPAFRSMMDGNRHSSSIGQFTSRCFLTREMAVRDHTDYVVRLVDNTTFSAFRDDDGDGVLDAGETLVGQWSLSDGVSLQNLSWTGGQVAFFPNGSASQTGDIRIRDGKGRSRTVRINSITGTAEVLP